MGHSYRLIAFVVGGVGELDTLASVGRGWFSRSRHCGLFRRAASGRAWREQQIVLGLLFVAGLAVSRKLQESHRCKGQALNVRQFRARFMVAASFAFSIAGVGNNFGV